MKYLEDYNNFVNEALLPSQYRNFVRNFKRNRYEKLFKEYKKKYDGDRNAYRIYLPLNTHEEENPLEIEIKNFLDENGYDVIDYFKGICKFREAKNPSKIGRVLTRLKAADLMKSFVEDPERKKGVAEELMVCISRHPYDIAGADTDRDWLDCMSLGLPETHPKMKRMKKEKDPKLSSYKLIGCNSAKLMSEITEGSLVSYLIRKDDKNINSPLSVLNIKPYVSEKGKGIYLCASKGEYGIKNSDFKATVEDWLIEVNKEKKGIFNLAPGVYSDCDPATYNTKGLTLNKWLKSKWGDNISYTNSEINCAYAGITSLKGIEKFKNLTRLICYGNMITSIENVEKLEKLVDLQCNDNRLTSLKGIENLTKLRYLYCHNNRISSLKELENLVNIEQLYIYGNSLKNLKGIEKLNKLILIFANENQLTSIKEIENLKLLQQICCNNNRLTSLEGFKGLKDIIYICAHYNKLKDLKGLEDLTRLTTLTCFNNNLTSLKGIENCKNINSLQCNDNELTSLEGIEELKNLSYLYCQNNKITSLKETKNLTKLDTLVANNNPLDKTDEDNKKIIKKFGIQIK